MSVSGRKGLIGENGVTNFINLWFPDHEQGIGAKRVRSKGVNDIGDVDGVPYTCIEVKNHSNPPVSTLLDNAEWKSENANRPIWFLVYKRDGYGEMRARSWHSMVTVKGFLDGFMPVSQDGQVAFDIDKLDELCDDEIDIIADIGRNFPTLPTPELRWKLKIMFRPYMRSVQSLRDKDMAGHISSSQNQVPSNPDELVIPIVITPRLGGANRENLGKWYCYTNLYYMVRALETMGVVPQDLSEYN